MATYKRGLDESALVSISKGGYSDAFKRRFERIKALNFENTLLVCVLLPRLKKDVESGRREMI